MLDDDEPDREILELPLLFEKLLLIPLRAIDDKILPLDDPDKLDGQLVLGIVLGNILGNILRSPVEDNEGDNSEELDVDTTTCPELEGFSEGCTNEGMNEGKWLDDSLGSAKHSVQQSQIISSSKQSVVKTFKDDDVITPQLTTPVTLPSASRSSSTCTLSSSIEVIWLVT